MQIRIDTTTPAPTTPLEVAEQGEGQTLNFHCIPCNQLRDRKQVRPYELAPLGFHGTTSAYICLTCGEF